MQPRAPADQFELLLAPLPHAAFAVPAVEEQPAEGGELRPANIDIGRYGFPAVIARDVTAHHAVAQPRGPQNTVERAFEAAAFVIEGVRVVTDPGDRGGVERGVAFRMGHGQRAVD